MADKSADLLRAVDVCKRVAHEGDVLLFDVRTISASLGLEESHVTDALVSNGLHVVDYLSPGFEAFQVSAASTVSTRLRRVASFAKFRGGTP